MPFISMGGCHPIPGGPDWHKEVEEEGMCSQPQPGCPPSPALGCWHSGFSGLRTWTELYPPAFLLSSVCLSILFLLLVLFV